MIKRWIGYLLALLALLGARLPGPSAGEWVAPSREIRFRYKDRRGRTITLEVGTEAMQLPAFSEPVTGIIIQKVEPAPDRMGYVAAGSPLKSRAEVKVESPYAAEWRLRSEVGEQLLSGTGYYAITTGDVVEKHFYGRETMIVEGKGLGRWKILE